MELAFAASKAGESCAKAGSILLHSTYDPRKEAERFIDAALGRRRPSCFLLSGPCLDYLSPALRRRFPGALILAIQHDARFRDRSAGADDSWYPDSPEPLAAFLSRHLDEDALAGIQVLEWPPAARAWPEEAAAAAAAVRAQLDRLASSAATLRTFGRQWMANACRNFLFLDEVLTPGPTSLPIVVASAGPSLPEALDLLGGHRSRFVLLAVSSALTTCLAKGLVPDLVVATDGGFWSRLHLYPLAARTTARALPLAMPLTALPSASLAGSFKAVLLDQGNFPEPELLASEAWALALPSHGTVTGTAVRLAARLGDAPIILAGMDFANYGLLSHARPHGFDQVCRDAQSRLEPEESLLYAREPTAPATSLARRPWRTSRSLAIYAEALSAESLRPPLAGRLFRLLPSPVPVAGCRDLGPEGLGGLLGGGHGSTGLGGLAFNIPPWPTAAKRRELLASRLTDWSLMASEAAATLRGGSLPSSPRARELFRAVDLPWWAAACRLVGAGEDAAGAASELETGTMAFLRDLKERLL